ncbi:MAG: hypothetical protein GF309_09515 [Candidatus Lokiarchaeota archaeon]|nr:hypothetical protein [Candidatus Lokiarchaeota archaeon]
MPDKKTGEIASSADPLSIQVYGGTETEILKSLKSLMSQDEEIQSNQTWVNVGALRRLAFLFEGGVESAGGLIGLAVMFILLGVVLIAFAIWQIFIFFIVIAALTSFSGGAALKYLKCTYLTVPAHSLTADNLAVFFEEQLSFGRFATLSEGLDFSEQPELVRKSGRATRIFRLGIHMALAVATLLLLFELVGYFVFGDWITETSFLILHGIAFLLGIAIMDAGVILRHSLVTQGE